MRRKKEREHPIRKIEADDALCGAAISFDGQPTDSDHTPNVVKPRILSKDEAEREPSSNT